MEQISAYTYDGWVVQFRKNVHMYTHSLTVEKNGEIYDICCEDTTLDFVSIAPYQDNLPAPVLQELLPVLRAWAEQTGMKYRLYRSRDDYVTNLGDVAL